jgi:hypothetical protein
MTYFPVIAHLSTNLGRESSSKFCLVNSPQDFPMNTNIRILKTNACKEDLDLIMNAIRISEDNKI